MDVFYAIGEKLPPMLTIFEENIERECKIIGKKPKAVVNGAVLFAIFSFVVSFPVFLILGFPFLSILIAVFGFYYKYNQASVEATQVVMEAQNEIIFASLLLAIYIRINRNLEGAVKFAGKSAKGIVGDILRKVSWSVEMREESNVERALDKHASILRELDETFIKVLELLKMSISEKQSARFEDIIDKGLSLQLSATNEKMQRYVEAISNPVKLIFSFLMLFPMMLLIMIPIIGIFLGREIPPSLLFIVFNLAIPLVAYYYVTTVLAKRPGTLAVHITPEIREKYGGIRIGENVFSPVAATAIFLIISVPFLLGVIALNFGLFESAFIVYIAAIAIGIYYFGRSYGLMDIRSKISEMEKDFRASLKELAVVLRQNIPIENAIAMMVEEGRKIGTVRKGAVDLWGKILEKIKIEGKTLKGAIFGREGVIKEYPSVMISDILYVISESAEKGPRQTAASTIKAAEYLDRTFEINARVNEMLSEITNTVSMMSTFIMPLVGGVAVAFGDLIAKFIIVMSKKAHGAEGFGIFSFGGAAFSSVDMQFIIGFYVLEMLIILGMFESGIKQGYDEVGRAYTIAKNIFVGFTVYIVSLIASWALLNLLISGIAI
ncbi:MAG: hypothetical protein QXY05_00540 [Candidatus Anstonellales archaeon]